LSGTNKKAATSSSKEKKARLLRNFSAANFERQTKQQLIYKY